MRSRPIEDFYLAADGDDWSPAFRRAQRSLAEFDSMEILLGSRTYRCATAIKIWTRLHIVGCTKFAGQSLAATSTGETHAVSRLWFDTGSHGIITMYSGQNTWDTHTPSATDPACTDSVLGITGDCRYSVLRDFVVEGIGGTSSSGNYHGLIPMRPITLEGMVVVNWPGNCLYMNVSSVGTTLTSSSQLNTVQTFLGNCNNSSFRDTTLLNAGRHCAVIRSNDANAMCLEQITFQNAGQVIFPSPLTQSSISSGAGAAGPTLSIVFTSASHGLSVGDLVILRGIVIGGTTYGTKCCEPVRVTSVSSATVVFNTAMATSQTWPTAGAASFGSTTRIAKPIQAIPSAGSFTADNTLELTVPSHSFQLNDMVLLYDMTPSSGSALLYSAEYPIPCRVSATTSTTVTVVGPDEWPSSGTAVLGTYPRIIGVEMQLANNGYLNNTFSSCKMQPTIFGGIQTYSTGQNTVFLGHYEETSTTPTLIDSTGLVLGGNVSNNTIADIYRSTAALLKPTGVGGLTIQRYLTALPNYYDHGVAATLGGATSNSLLEFNFKNKASGTTTDLYTNSYRIAHESRNGDNAGYLDFKHAADNASGYTTIALPVSTNNRNPRTIALNAGAYIGGVGTNGTSSKNISANPDTFNYLGSVEPASGFAVFLFGDTKKLLVTGVADNGSGLNRITTATHGLATGDRVMISGVAAPLAANGLSTITYVSTTAFDLTSSFSGSYTTYTAAISSASYDSDYNITTFAVSGASGTLAAGDRATLGSGADNRDIQVLYVSGSTIKVLGDFSGATGNITMNTGLVHRVHAIGYATTYPTSGAWGNGDIIYNTAPSTEAPSYWVCTTGGASGGTWLACYPNHRAYTVTGNVTRGHMGLIRVPFTAAGTGNMDDITIYAANAPVAMRIVQVYAYISTGGGSGDQTLQLRTSTMTGGGYPYTAGGSALSGTISTATTGFKSVNTTATATTTVAAGGSIYLHRRDRDVAGEFFIVTMEE